MRLPSLEYVATGLLSTGVLLWAAPAKAEVITLQNDGYVDGANVGFQGGFGIGEHGAVTLGPVTETFTVQEIQFLFGPEQTTGNQQPVTLRIYEDNAGTPEPGVELYANDYQVEGANDAMLVIDLVPENVVVPGGGKIRVSFEFQHSGAPSIARDDDGTYTPDVNWIFSGTWSESDNYGVTGDWIIRAKVETEGGAGGTGGTGASGGTGGTGASGGTGGSSMLCTPGQVIPCTGPGGCEGEQVCLADGMGYGACQCPETEDDSGCSLAPKRFGDRSGWGLGHGATLALLLVAGARRRSRRTATGC